MKNLIARMLVFLVTFSLFGCTGPLNTGSKDNTASVPSSAGTLSATKSKKPVAPTQAAATQKAAQAAVSPVSLTSPSGDFPAPAINGLNIKPGGQGGTAEYLDSQGRSVLQVEASPLNDGSDHSVQLKQLLDKIYGPSSPYVQSRVYPRFTYPLPGVNAGFFAVDASLTASQVLLLKEALDLFNRPEFAAMKPDLFDPGIAYVLIDKTAGDSAGLTYAGTGVVELNRRDLFGNKYMLASVIAHEGSHVLQGPTSSNVACSELLKREVGDQTIPAGFYQWDGATLLQAIKDRQIGAYHVSLWMLNHLGVKDTGWIAQAIQTGMVGGESVVSCKL